MKIILVLSLFLIGCTDTKLKNYDHKVTISVSERHFCNTPELQQRVLDFVVKCSEAANPKSDEEGEDLVAQCEKTAKTTICPIVTMCLKQYGHKDSFWKECPPNSKAMEYYNE